jgi:hypothetical protein
MDMLNQNSNTVNTDEENHVTDEGDPRKYFTQIPNILFSLGLSPYALTLYVYFKKVAGEGGACWQKTSTIAKATGMSDGMVTKAKAELSKPRPELKDDPQGKAKPLIVIANRNNKHGGKPGHIIRLTDIWSANIANITRIAKPISPHEIDHSQDEIAISPHEIKKNPSEEKPTKEKHTQHLRAVGAPAVAVCGGSRFTIEECRRYARHLQATGQGINNPGGYATTIKRTGDVDALIEEFLSRTPEQVEEIRTTPANQNLFFGEAVQMLQAMMAVGRDPQAIINDMPLDDDTRRRLIEKFIEAQPHGSKAADNVRKAPGPELKPAEYEHEQLLNSPAVERHQAAS